MFKSNNYSQGTTRWDDQSQSQSLKYENFNLKSEVAKLKKSNDLLQQQKKTLETRLNKAESELKRSVVGAISGESSYDRVSSIPHPQRGVTDPSVLGPKVRSSDMPRSVGARLDGDCAYGIGEELERLLANVENKIENLLSCWSAIRA